jgi:hypothetical protein
VQRDAASVIKVSELMHIKGDPLLEVLDEIRDRLARPGRKFGRNWDVAWYERPLSGPSVSEEPLAILALGHEVAPRTQTDDSHSSLRRDSYHAVDIATN